MAGSRRSAASSLRRPRAVTSSPIKSISSSRRRRSTRMCRLFSGTASPGAPTPPPAAPAAAVRGAAARRSSPPTDTCSTSPAPRTARSISAAAADESSRKLNRPSKSSDSKAAWGGVTPCTAPSPCARLRTSSARPPLSGASARRVTCTSRPPPGAAAGSTAGAATGADRAAPTGAGLAGVRSHSSSSWLQALKCSRLSARNSSAYCERSMDSAEDPLHGFEDARRLERLHDEVLRSRLDRLDHQRLLPHRAAHQDLRVGILLDDLAHGIDAAHVRHDDVHGHEIGLELSVFLDRLGPRLRFAHDLETGLGQDVRDHRPHEDGVVADEDSVAHTPSLGRQNGG